MMNAIMHSSSARFWLLFVGLSLAWCSAPLIGQANGKGQRGTIDGEVTWSGKVLVDGDVIVAPTGVLVIQAGTEVTIASSDATKSGFHPARVEIQVQGRLRIQGTEDAPVVFTPTVVGKIGAMTWHGVVIRPAVERGQPSILSSVRFVGAFAAVQVPRGAPLIVDSVFKGCEVGVEVGSAYCDGKNYGIGVDELGLATPEIRGCRFASCATGVFCERQASPDVRNSVFYRCGIALGNERQGYSSPLADPGAVVERCAFIENGRGVKGQSLVQHSIFMRNEVAIVLSSFHDPFSVHIDHVAMRANLYHANKKMIVGDTGLDNDPILGDPRFVGGLAGLDELGPALPKSLMLGPKSPAKGRGFDGGDLGPFGKGSGTDSRVVWKVDGSKVATILAMPLGIGAADKKVIASRPKPGARVGKRWWVSATRGTEGEVDLVATFGKASSGNVGGWLAFVAKTKRSGKAKVALEINGDIDRVRLFVNGQGIKSLDQDRRFGARGVVVDVALKSGVNHFSLHVQGWGMRPRIGFAFADGVTFAKPPKAGAGVLKIQSGKLLNKKTGRVLELVVGNKLHWGDAGRVGVCEVRDKEGRKLEGCEQLELVVLSAKKLRLNAVPAAWKGPLSLVLKGLRSPSGGVYAAAPRKTIR